MPEWWVDLPDLPPGSAQALAVSLRGPFGNVVARLCLRRGIGPGHPEWPYLSRTIVAFGGSLAGLDGRTRPPEWWESHWIVPAVVRPDEPPPSPVETLLARQDAAAFPSPSQPAAAAAAAHAVLPAFWLPSWPRVLARAGTGPPTGPPLSGAGNSVTSDERGRSAASPAVLIRAD